MRASSAALRAARAWWMEHLSADGAQLSVNGDTVLVGLAGVQVQLRADAGDMGRLADRDAPVPPPGKLFCVSMPLRSLARLHFKIVREWERLGPAVWPGAAFSEPELQATMRDHEALFAAMRGLLERHPVCGLWLDEQGSLHLFVDGEAHHGAAFDPLWTDLETALKAWAEAAPALAARALVVRGRPGAPALPPRLSLEQGAARVEGTPIAVPLSFHDPNVDRSDEA